MIEGDENRLAQILRFGASRLMEWSGGSIMKVLIGFNGSRISENALEDLKHAGLPADAEVDIISVAESRPVAESEDEAIGRARYAKKRLTEEFGFARVNAEARAGLPGYEILDRSRSFGADLIVLGEDRTPFDEHNMFLRSTCEKVLREAECSVRIARGNPKRDASPSRIVIGYDGSPGADIAVKVVSERQWLPDSQVRLVVVTDTAVLSSIGRFSPQMTDPRVEAKIAGQWVGTLAELPLQRLKNSGLKAEFCVESGNPKNVIVKHAEAWKADSIFVGPHCHGNSFERFLLGSVSAAVAARAHCTVEVVRAS